MAETNNEEIIIIKLRRFESLLELLLATNLLNIANPLGTKIINDTINIFKHKQLNCFY